MKRETYVCDRCGSKGTIHHFCYVTGTSSDGMENSWDWETTDLCGYCLGAAMRLVLSSTPRDERVLRLMPKIREKTGSFSEVVGEMVEQDWLTKTGVV